MDTITLDETPAGRAAARYREDAATLRQLHLRYPPGASPAALAAVARHVEREYGPTGYVVAVLAASASLVVVEARHFDGSRFVLVGDRYENVVRVDDPAI